MFCLWLPKQTLVNLYQVCSLWQAVTNKREFVAILRVHVWKLLNNKQKCAIVFSIYYIYAGNVESCMSIMAY